MFLDTGVLVAKAWRQVTYRINISEEFTSRVICPFCSRKEILSWTRFAFTMFASPHDRTSFTIFFYRDYETRYSNFIASIVREGDFCWDIGASRGWYALLLGKIVGPSGRVDAFEASPTMFPNLQKNIDLNKFAWVYLHQYAISETSGIGHFMPMEIERVGRRTVENSGGAHLVTEHNEDSVDVQMIRLDDFADEKKTARLDLIKIDIEGAEMVALLGATKVLQRFRPKILIEYYSRVQAQFGKTLHELDSFLDHVGYNRYVIEIGLRPINSDDLNRETMYMVYCEPREISSHL